jgi:hypothetical protein
MIKQNDLNIQFHVELAKEKFLELVTKPNGLNDFRSAISLSEEVLVCLFRTLMQALATLVF